MQEPVSIGIERLQATMLNVDSAQAALLKVAVHAIFPQPGRIDRFETVEMQSANPLEAGEVLGLNIGKFDAAQATASACLSAEPQFSSHLCFTEAHTHPSRLALAARPMSLSAV